MKIALKYGLLAAVGLIVWVLASHTLVPNPNSPLHSFGATVVFNVLNFVMIFLGLRALEREKGDKPAFKEALKTGVSIAFVYALAGSLFFVGVVFVVGAAWLPREPGAPANTPTAALLLQAFAGLFLLTLLLGLVYSTVIAFFVAKRRSEE